MSNSYLDRQSSRKIGVTGRKSETKMAKRLGARLTPASGAANTKGDAVLGNVLLEAKSTTSSSISLKLDWLVKIAGEALLTGRSPALTVTFTDDKGNPHRDGAWVLIPERDFRDLMTTD